MASADRSASPVVPGRADGCEPLPATADDFATAVTTVTTELCAALAHLASVGDDAALTGRRPGVRSWSVLERVVGVADAFHTRARLLRAIADGERHRLYLLHIDAPRVGVNEWPPRAARAALELAADELRRQAARIPSAAWEDGHIVGGSIQTVRTLLAGALREARSALDVVGDRAVEARAASERR